MTDKSDSKLPVRLMMGYYKDFNASILISFIFNFKLLMPLYN